MVAYVRTVLDATHDRIACAKPQSAFFEALGVPGIVALAQVLADLRDRGIPAILDAKRGDVGSTAEAYAAAYLADGVFAADALTVNAYLGLDTLEPFLNAAVAGDRGVFVLVKTSNPGSGDLQDVATDDGRRVYERLADALAERAERLPRGADGYAALGAVAGATYPAEVAALRARLPRALLLVPGYGAQGGTAADAVGAFDARRPRRRRQREPDAALPHRRRRRRRGGAGGRDRDARRPQPRPRRPRALSAPAARRHARSAIRAASAGSAPYPPGTSSSARAGNNRTKVSTGAGSPTNTAEKASSSATSGWVNAKTSTSSPIGTSCGQAPGRSGSLPTRYMRARFSARNKSTATGATAPT